MLQQNRALPALAIWILGAAGSSCASSPVASATSSGTARCDPGKICVSIARGLMGDGDAVCALDPSRRFLDVKLVADCPTTAPLILTVRNADPYDQDFLPVREERPETLIANTVRPLRTTKPLPITPQVKRLRLAVEAKCDGGDSVNMRYGDAPCDVPPIERSK